MSDKLNSLLEQRATANAQKSIGDFRKQMQGLIKNFGGNSQNEIIFIVI